jgi:outer membrane lipoprotein-sorting protein
MPRTGAALGMTALAMLVVSLGASFSGVQAAEKTPTAEQILDTFVKATGGVAAYDKLQSSVSKGALEIPAAGITVDITVYSARPNKMCTVAESPAIGKNERGTDGTIFWEKSTMQGARVLEGEELAEALREAAFEGLVYWRGQYDSVAVSGVDTVSGNPCYKVVMKAKGGKPRTLSFDQKSGLLVRTQTTVPTQMGEIPVESFPGDYRKVGEVLQAYKSTVKVMGQERVMTMTSVEYNTTIPDSVFAVPADVQALLQKK